VVSSHLDSRWRAPSKLLFQLEPHGTGGPKFPVRVTNRAILPVRPSRTWGVDHAARRKGRQARVSATA
jgi:hypothetical protein